MIRRPSLTSTIAGAFALITLATLSIAGTYLYENLQTQLISVKNDEIVIKAKHLRSLVEGEDSLAGLMRDQARFVGQSAGNDFFVEQIRSADDAVLLEVNPSHLLPQSKPVTPAGRLIAQAGVRRWHSASAPATRGIAAQARFRDSSIAIVVVGGSQADIDPLLARQRNALIRTMLIAAFAATLIGYLWVRRALLPLRRITAEASGITADNLSVRLEHADAPPEFEALSASLNDMFARLERGFGLLSEYTENLAHDLRTPISNLRGQTEVALARTRPLAEYEALLASNLEEYERLSRMFENILFLARAGSTQIAVSRSTLDLPEQLNHLAEYFEGLALDRSLTLAVRASGHVMADPTLFRRAVSNLLDNAIRHADAGGIIDVTSSKTADATIVSVRNLGEDIPAEQLGRIFDRFYRADSARTNSADSTGLGLSIVHSIMGLHGGTVAVQSSGGVTRFQLMFPG